MRKILTLMAVLCLGTASIAIAQPAGPPGGAIWADGTAYQTVLTPTNLPNKGPKDGLYSFANLDGQAPVSESKPGDRDYNGGRWQVYVLEFTEEGLAVHDEDGDGVADFELTSWEQVNEHIGLGHLEQKMMGPSFVCPLVKR